uniref:alpha-actinin-3-like isoform X3 n=1 Tax=Halichoerus grypus TaxID=9711 RepID=UPI00165972E0|nr:alpha-actinin-3-like isoform X3 [Halichoerus grypus]
MSHINYCFPVKGSSERAERIRTSSSRLMGRRCEMQDRTSGASQQLFQFLGLVGPWVKADERDRVQKKTFTKWVNKHLMKVRKHINDLYEDLRDGHNLISLLEVLSGIKLPREKGRMRFHRLQNVQIALDFLKQRQVR